LFLLERRFLSLAHTIDQSVKKCYCIEVHLVDALLLPSGICSFHFLPELAKRSSRLSLKGIVSAYRRDHLRSIIGLFHVSYHRRVPLQWSPRFFEKKCRTLQLHDSTDRPSSDGHRLEFSTPPQSDLSDSRNKNKNSNLSGNPHFFLCLYCSREGDTRVGSKSSTSDQVASVSSFVELMLVDEC